MIETTSASESLWLTTNRPTSYPRLEGELNADVAVLGGGIAGLTTALLLKRQGARVAVLEAARVGSGVTGCTTAKVSALQSTLLSTVRQRRGREAAEAYAQASLAGVERLAQLVAEEAIDCELERRPALTYAGEEGQREAVEQEAAVATEAGLPVELVEATSLPYATHGAARLEGQLQCHPVSYCQGLAAAIDGDGSAVLELTRATGVSEGSPATVHTEAGTVHADRVVVATHYPILDRALYFTRLEPQRSYCIAARLHRPEKRLEMAISAGEPTRSVRAYRELLIVGGEGHPTGSSEATEERFITLERFAAEHWATVEVTHRWSAHDLMPYDAMPMIGAYHPRSDRLLVATGFMKWGLATATFAGELLADLVAGHDNPWASAFSPSRITARGAPQVAQLGMKFSADLIGDRLRPPQALGSDRIPPGEARTLPDGIGRKGVYRDREGGLHAVSLRCTHLGCLLRFNAAERSWDCPCHGSRFGVDGEVLEGPAVRPLQPRDP